MAEFKGTLAIVANEPFLTPDDGSAQKLMLMRNPPQRSAADRIAAARALFRELGLGDTAPVTVTGDLVDLGEQQAIAIDDARRTEGA